MRPATYDELGVGYARFRHPDPRIETRIHRVLGTALRVINVGAGTGSYEPSDRCVLAVEPSEEMIHQRPTDAAPCLHGDVGILAQFGNGAFDAAMALLTVHHWPDPKEGLRELGRVGRGVVIFCFEPALHNAFWLFRDYVPAITRLPSTGGAIPVDEIAELVGADRIEAVPIPHDCVDGFGWAYWRRPHAYLDPEVRRCISAFGLLAADEVERGLARLRADLVSGRWQDRHRNLLDLDAVDGGFRLVVRDAR